MKIQNSRFQFQQLYAKSHIDLRRLLEIQHQRLDNTCSLTHSNLYPLRAQEDRNFAKARVALKQQMGSADFSKAMMNPLPFDKASTTTDHFVHEVFLAAYSCESWSVLVGETRKNNGYTD